MAQTDSLIISALIGRLMTAIAASAGFAAQVGDWAGAWTHAITQCSLLVAAILPLVSKWRERRRARRDAARCELNTVRAEMAAIRRLSDE
ncbi:hypothetical protein [Thiorhodococcus fuscus]|uniref:Uncharacterized protein n=1 Tax=Thiorhodococcus fuscus TaxID=527200 RepID=A0ABW4Y959_9GAMM